MALNRPSLQLHETNDVINLTGFSGSGVQEFAVHEGARLVIDLIITNTTGTVTADIENSADGSNFLNVLTLSGNSTSVIRRVYADFHRTFRVNYDVSGGTADFKLVITVRDNSASTFIENANLLVDVDHTAGDSVQVGDGVEIIEVNPDGSINVQTDIKYPDDQRIIVHSVASANSEFSINLPDGTRRYIIQAEDGKAKLRLAFNSGDTNLDNYKIINKGNQYDSGFLSLPDNTTLYMQSTVITKIRIEAQVLT